MRTAMKRVLHWLPAPVFRQLGVIRDQLSIRTFRPRIVEHNYGGIPLSVSLADRMSAQWYDHDWPESPEIKFLKGRRQLEGALVFDLGAHQGVVALTIASAVGPSGKVVAVEGGRRNFEIALQNVRLNNAENLVVLNAVVDSASGSSVLFGDQINGSVSASGSGHPVMSCSIDGLAAQYGVPDFIMLDIEGYECRALDGARATLKVCANWCVEVHAGCGLESFGGSAEQIIKTFNEAGYSLYCYVEGQNEVHPLSEIPHDRFFLVASQN